MKALFFLLLSFSSFSFDLGSSKEQRPWGINLKDIQNKTDLQLNLGFRLQGALSYSDQDKADIYLRRTRFQLDASFLKDMSFYMDIRNDRVGYEDKGDGEFTVGDAYYAYKTKKYTLKAYRAKVDVSRTQTISSSKLLLQDRAQVSDYAANFVSSGRRASNLQINSFINNYIYYQLVLGDGLNAEDLEDLTGNSVDSIRSQNFIYGGKLKLSFLKEWSKKNLTETHFGKGEHLELGVGKFFGNGIKFKDLSGNDQKMNRSLTNVELSFHKSAFSFVGEYFHFKNTLDDLTNFKTRDSEGFYVQGEYLFEKFHYTSLVFRYEDWAKYNSSNLESKIIGANYYLKGNKFRIGANFEELKELNEKNHIFKITSQIHY